MKRRFWLLCTSLVLPALSAAQAQSSAGQGQTVQGTQQLAGADATVSKTYTLYPGSDKAINYTLNKLEYVAGHFIHGSGSSNFEDRLPKPGKKLLVLHFTIQNPQQKEVTYNSDAIRFTGVDSANASTKDGGWFDAKTFRPVSMKFKPAQKLDVVSYMVLPAEVSLPKLIVDDANNKVWRYDLRGKISPLPAPFRDPASADGSAALSEIPAQMGTYYAGEVDFRVDRMEFLTEPTLGQKVPKGGRLLVVYATLNNVFPKELSARSPNVKFLDQDGRTVSASTDAFLAGRDTKLGGKIPAGQELGIRLVVAVPAGLEPQQVRLTPTDGRTYLFTPPAQP